MEYGLCFEGTSDVKKREHIFPSNKLCAALLWQNCKLPAFNILSAGRVTGKGNEGTNTLCGSERERYCVNRY